MRNKLLLMFVATALTTLSTFAAVGPQSICVTFNGSGSEGWTTTSTNASIGTTTDGVVNVQMGLQSNNKYRADFQYQTSGTFTFDKAKDIVWAIKLTAPLPGTSNSCKFEINCEKGGTDKWVNGINNSAGNFTCADGGKIYYFTPNTQSSTKWGEVPDGNVVINNIHFILADATDLTEETARYSVDWVATFSSVEDLKFYTDWKDEQTNFDEPMFEHCFRPKVDGSGNESSYPKSGISNNELEANYQAQIVAVEYFLIDYSIEDIYTLEIAQQGGGGTNPMSIWNFPHLADRTLNAGTLNGYLTSIVGFAPKAAEGTANEPIATASCNSSKWTLTIPAYKLTPLAEIGTKTLVGLLITSSKDNLMAEGKSAKFASSCNTEKSHPSLTYTGSNPVVNLTQSTASATLSEAVTAANAGDVLELRSDVTISGSRLEIKKPLTIQGATGSEKIICGVAWNTLMVLANGTDAEYTVTFRKLIVDGQNTVRDRQLFDTNEKAKMAFEDVTVINTAYSVVTGDVKSAGYGILLSGNNTFPYGIYLNQGKRIDNQNATTHTTPIKVILSGDYAENYAIVTNCDDASLYDIRSAVDTYRWEIYETISGSTRELKGNKIFPLTLGDNTDNSATLLTNNGKRMDVTLNRTIAANGDYATFCVPFDIDADMMNEQLGNPEVLRYKRTDIVSDVATLVFDAGMTSIEAGVPYLIKPTTGSDITSMTFSGVTIDNTINEASDSHYRFIPIFSQTQVTESANHSIVYLGAGNQLYYAAANATIKGFRAYFRALSAPAMAAQRMVIGRRDMPTSIDDVQGDEASNMKVLRDWQVVIIRNGAEYNALGQRIK